MADAEQPPLFPCDDAESDGECPGSGDVAGGDQAGDWPDEWPLEATDEWTDPMGRAGTDPFDAPIGLAREPLAERARAARVPVAPGGAPRAPGWSRGWPGWSR